jgi:CHASE3 domain sensor protein
MANKYVASYLTDHLAGSVMAIDLLHQLEDGRRGTQMAREFYQLRADIEADRNELRTLMNDQQIGRSRVHQTAAWIAAKLAELKLRLEDSNDGPLRLLESIEVVALGIDGKSALWRALEAAAEFSPELQGIDYKRLKRRAEKQRERAEKLRVLAAKAALATIPIML